MPTPLSEIQLEPGGLPGLELVPARYSQEIAKAFQAAHGRRTDAALAYASAVGGSPFTAHRNLCRWITGKQRMRPETYDLLWTLI